MRLSQSENKIKQSLEERQITPSANLWDTIQEELDNNSKPKKKFFWYKVASVAAVFCLSFLAYQSLTKAQVSNSDVVFESKPVIIAPIQIETVKMPTSMSHQTLVAPEAKTQGMTRSNNAQSLNSITANTNKDLAVLNTPNQIKPGDKSSALDNEIDELLAIVEANAQEKSLKLALEDEVNNLLSAAIAQTDDEKDKEIYKKISVELLLAEVESEIDLDTPKFRDKVWSAIVANFNDIKKDLAFN